MRTGALVTATLLGGSVLLAAIRGALADFAYGHVYISLTPAEPFCTYRGEVWEYNPDTNQLQFAFYPPFCGELAGLSFSPDSTRLRMAGIAPANAIAERDQAGAPSIQLTSSHGLAGPLYMVLDPWGNLFVTNSFARRLLKFPFPAIQVPGLIFADVADGVGLGGGLSFSPDGDLYYVGGDPSSHILRFTPDGAAREFAVLPGPGEPGAIAIDSKKNIYVMRQGTVTEQALFKYSAGNPDTPQLLTTAAFGLMALSADETSLYVVGQHLWKVDVSTGAVTTLADPPSGSLYWGTGIAVCKRHGPGVPGDMNCDGRVDAFDVPVFALALIDPDRYRSIYPGCSLDNANFTRDLDIDGSDIQGFVQRMAAQ